MAYDQKDMSGVLFRNDRKEKDSHPDYTGNARIDGVEYWLSAWIKDGRNGKFMSLALKPKEERTKPRPSHTPNDGATGGARSSKAMDDEIPFAPEWR